MESLAKLGERLKKLPEGWQYRSRILTEDLVLDLDRAKRFMPWETNTVSTTRGSLLRSVNFV
jgi:hypothetical protein